MKRSHVKKTGVLLVLLTVLSMSSLFAANIQVGTTISTHTTAVEFAQVLRGEDRYHFDDITFSPYLKTDISFFSADATMLFHKLKTDDGSEYFGDLRFSGGFNFLLNGYAKLYCGASMSIKDIIYENSLNGADFMNRVKDAAFGYYCGVGFPIGKTELIVRANFPTQGTLRTVLTQFKGLCPELKQSTVELAGVLTF